MATLALIRCHWCKKTLWLPGYEKSLSCRCIGYGRLRFNVRACLKRARRRLGDLIGG